MPRLLIYLFLLVSFSSYGQLIRLNQIDQKQLTNFVLSLVGGGGGGGEYGSNLVIAGLNSIKLTGGSSFLILSNNQLFVDTSTLDASNAFILGSMLSRTLTINSNLIVKGEVTVGNSYRLPTTNGLPYQTLVTDGAGNSYWLSPAENVYTNNFFITTDPVTGIVYDISIENGQITLTPR